MRYGKDQSELVRRFSMETGRALRSAQWHRKQQTDEWKEFCARRAGVAESLEKSVPVVGPAPLPEDPEDKTKNATDSAEKPAAMNRAVKTREEEMELSAFIAWKQVSQMVANAIRGRDVNVAAFIKAEHLAQKGYRDARRMREQAEMTAGRLRPASEFMELKRTLLGMLIELVNNMPREVGPRANPFDADFAISALQDWIYDRWNPAMENAAAVLRKYEPIQIQTQAEQPEQ